MVEIVNATPLEALGAAMSLLYGTRYDQRKTADNMRLLVPPINAGQCLVFGYEGDCVGVVTWAHMSEASEAKYLDGWPKFIDAEDWVSGNRVWFMAVYITPPHTMACIRLARDVMRAAIKDHGWLDVLHTVRDKPGQGLELREIQYA